MAKAVLIKNLPRSGSHYLLKNLQDCGVNVHKLDASYIGNVAADNIMTKNIFKDTMNIETKDLINITRSSFHKKYVCSIFILRNPQDSIISHMAQNFYNKENLLESDLSIESIVTEAYRLAEGWSLEFTLAKKHMDILLPFTFEQLIDRPNQVIDLICKYIDHDKPYIFKNIQTKDVPKNYNDNGVVININYLKTSKSVNFYNVVNDILRNHLLFSNVNDLYLNLLQQINDRQKELEINF
jgi:hypothetical protein